MDESTGISASEVDATSVIAAPNEPLEKVGKREAEDAIRKEVVSAKRQKVEGLQSEVKNVENSELDDFSSQSELQMKVTVCPMEGHMSTVSGDESSGLEEDASAAKKKPAVAAKSGLVAAPEKRDESSDDSYSSSEDETNTVEDVAATKRAPASLTREGPITPAKKTDGSSSEDQTNADDDIAAAKEAHTTPGIKKSGVSTLKKDESKSDDWTTSHVNAAMAEKNPAAPTKMDPVNAINSKTKDDESFDEDDVTAKNISAPVTTKKDQSIEDSESDNKLINDSKTTAASNERTTGPKTLYVGNLSFSVEQEDVEHFFKAAGEIVGIRFGMNPDESFRGFGFVEFSSAEAAEKALHDLNGKELLRRPVKLDLLRERGSYTPYSGKNTQSFQKGERAQGQKIFVRGFNKFDGEDKIRSSLKEHFGSCGEITRVSLPTNQDGAVKGLAIIFFKDSDACSRALELNGSEFGGSTLSVEEARSGHDNRDSGGSGGGRGWRSDGAVGGRGGGWDRSLSAEEVKSGHDNHDSGGTGGGCGWRSDGAVGGRGGGWDSTLSVEEVRSGHDNRDSGGSGGGCGWSSDGAVGGRGGGWDNTLSVEEAKPRHDSRDSGGWDISGRSDEVGFGTRNIFVCGFNKFDGEDKIRSSLKEHFGSCGEITRVSLPTDQNGAVKGIAFIFFKDSDACSRALELNGSEFGGSTLSVEEARSGHDNRDSGGSGGGRGWRSDGAVGGRYGGWDSILSVEEARPRHDNRDSCGGDVSGRSDELGFGRRKIFVRGFSKFDGEDKIRSSLKEHFGSCGEITRVSLPTDQNGAVKGIAFIFFKDGDACSRALELNGSEFGGSTLSVEEARSGHDNRDSGGRGWRSDGVVGGRCDGWDSTLSVEEARPRHDSRDSCGGDISGRSDEVGFGRRKIFVRGFNKFDGEDKIKSSLKEHFGSCGEITRVSLPTDQDGAVKGIAFIFFKDSDACSRALELNGLEFGGSNLLVEEARSRHDSRDSGGRGWRSGGWDSTMSVEEARPRRDSHDSSGNISDRGWRSGGCDVGGRTGEWDSTLLVAEAMLIHDSRDSGGSCSGRGLRKGGWGFGGRSNEVGFGRRIFVRGFNKSDGEDKIRSSLKEHFGSCGEITRVSLPTDQDGAVKGIAFIFFKDSDACSRALELNGSEFGGSTLLVEESRPRHDSRDSGGTGSGRGWRSGGRDFGGRNHGRGFGERSGARGFGGRSGGRGWSCGSGRGWFGGCSTGRGAPS